MPLPYGRARPAFGVSPLAQAEICLGGVVYGGGQILTHPWGGGEVAGWKMMPKFV